MPLHSNLVLFKLWVIPHLSTIRTTLHSNLVLFKSYSHWCFLLIFCSLHSNLVLFKCLLIPKYNAKPSLYIPIWFYSNPERPRQPDYWYYFTFQSGSIQIGVTENASKEANRFTFQSGSIQMIQEPKDSKRLWSLYIPIWFYSNVKG